MSDPDSPLDPIPDPSSPLREPQSSPPPVSLLPPPLPSSAQTEPPDLKPTTTPANSKSSRRLPPPCWSLEETIALIDGYRDKWYDLNRGNLKANHWEEVAESVGNNCPDATPKKTAVQCRHKMEKLRKRYRTEIQRARSVPVARFISSWVHYKRMEAMENRQETKQGNESGDDDEEDGDDGSYGVRYHNQFSGGSFKNGARTTTPRFFNRNGGGGSSSSGGGIRIRIPTGVSIAQPGPRFPGKIDPKYTASPSVNPRPGRLGAVRIPEGGGGSGSSSGKRGREMMMMTTKTKTKTREEEECEDDDDPMVEIASAIKLLGDTLLRTEQSKMEMTKEIEAMRMDMEMKRTKMILESQQRIVEAFAKSMSENLEEKKKKARRLSSLPAAESSL